MYGPSNGTLNCLTAVLIIGLISVASWGGYGVYKLFRGKKTTFESKVRLIPDYRLTASGKTIDTIFIYKIPK
jgi:hypothetical protein